MLPDSDARFFVSLGGPSCFQPATVFALLCSGFLERKSFRFFSYHKMSGLPWLI